MTNDERAQWAESHQTDLEIVMAMDQLADTAEEMERIWQDPTAAELASILPRAWEYVHDGRPSLVWGAARFMAE